MEDATVQNYTKTGERKPMSSVVEASYLLDEIAGVGAPGEYKKEAQERAFRKLRTSPIEWTRNRISDIAKRSDRVRVSAVELDELRRVAAKERKDAEVLGLEAIARRLDRTDPDFYRQEVAALRNVIGRLRQQDRHSG
jgi:hypothetical protein